ncbi:MAG: hypothetical protein SGI91_11690 [Alphaproteobacteria bacterium]|nr:hypothetical protein [Alphaproteobacteria bacterium]
MAVKSGNPWVRFLRSYGPIPTNDNMYDESIRRALRRYKIKPIELPAQFLDELLDNFLSPSPNSFFLTGTAGDGKTYHCREVFVRLGGNEEEWNVGDQVQAVQLSTGVEVIFIKDLSELQLDRSDALLTEAARDISDTNAKRVYLIAANHGQLLEKLKAKSPTAERARLSAAVEDMMVTERPAGAGLRLQLRDLSRSPVADLIGTVITAVTEHEGWAGCATCEHASGPCPIQENRKRLIGEQDGGLFKKRLANLVEISEHNGHHFPMRQLLVLITNILLGHPLAREGLMTCTDVVPLRAKSDIDQASVYRNTFGENLRPGRAERTEPFGKLSLFGIGSETGNAIDNVLVYGAHDPELAGHYDALMKSDPIYGATKAYTSAQADYLEGRDPKAEDRFLRMLRSQRQRLFFTMPPTYLTQHSVWDLTVFKFAGEFLQIVNAFRTNKPLPRESLPLMVRGLNRVFSGMLVQNNDELILATSGSHSQTKTSPLVDALVSVARRGGEEVTLKARENGSFVLSVRLTKDGDPAPVALVITPTRFEFLCRVAEGALPSSFSLECHEDFLAFKARLLGAAARRRDIDLADTPPSPDLELNFLDLSPEGRASQRRVSIQV